MVQLTTSVVVAALLAAPALAAPMIGYVIYSISHTSDMSTNNEELTLKNRPESLPFILPTGIKKDFEIYITQDGKEVIKCDLCKRPCNITPQRTLASLKRHRDTGNLQLTLFGEDSECAPRVLNMLRRSSCKLTTLTLTFVRFRGTDIVSFLANCPTLVKFFLETVPDAPSPTLSDTVVDVLDPSKALMTSTCSPNLTCFKFSGTINFTPSTMISMLEERLKWAKKYEEAPLGEIPVFRKLEVFDITY
ncbi:hypothetical protein NLJ89_g8208 [Agrocybe chaxingu]|uniref:Uncharacterized protein n=1 Tax=Agrocybe chaxingu TaxID=84603 RepID=A0A9W8JT28_9AGAR|nr:hypothetical protein NLJ89_g8208 [Agrocybe chaxingu]